MGDDDTPRIVTARRMALLGTVAAMAAPAGAEIAGGAAAADTPASFLVAQAEGEGEGGEGEGEGEGRASLDPTTALLRDLGFMTGHLRAGLALYDAGDLEAAKTHMGHPIEEKYDAVAAPLEAMGMASLRDDLLALSGAAEDGAAAADVRALFDKVIAGVEAARAEAAGDAPRTQVLALAALMRVAGDEYTIATEGGKVSNLHEYQDSWGFLQTIRTEGAQMAESGDAAVAAAGARIVEVVDDALDRVFGDIQGADIPEMKPSVIYGAAARIDLAGYGLE